MSKSCLAPLDGVEQFDLRLWTRDRLSNLLERIDPTRTKIDPRIDPLTTTLSTTLDRSCRRGLLELRRSSTGWIEKTSIDLIDDWFDRNVDRVFLYPLILLDSSCQR